MSDFPFASYLPRPWQFGPDEELVFSLTRSLGLERSVRFHHPGDSLNRNKPESDHVIISYMVNGRRYSLFSFSDFEFLSFAMDDTGKSNLIGLLAERISRRLMKRFLQLYQGGSGKLGGLFDKRFNPKKREGFVVASNGPFVLKIDKYPNMTLLEQTGRGKWGFQPISEIDGLFDYRIGLKRWMMILESKSGKVDVQGEHLLSKVFLPLKTLFPETHFGFVLFAEHDQLFDGKNPSMRMLKRSPKRLFQTLWDENIPSLFFQFQETPQELQEMANHIIGAYQAYQRKIIRFNGQTQITPHEIRFFQKGSKEPYLVLSRGEESGAFLLKQSGYRFWQAPRNEGSEENGSGSS
jgi:hypothetical protein